MGRKVQQQCSETSAYKIQTPGNYPVESIQHSEHGESLKSRILHLYGGKLQQQFSETSAYKIQTPGNYPAESIQHSEHGESLKLRILHLYGEEIATTVFRNVGTQNSDEGELPRSKHTTFRTRRKL